LLKSSARNIDEGGVISYHICILLLNFPTYFSIKPCFVIEFVSLVHVFHLEGQKGECD